MNDIGIIKLGGKRGGFAIVDASVFAEVNAVRWSLSSHGYPVTHYWNDGQNISVYLHKFLTLFSFTDHRNGFRIDNTSRNLRTADAHQNAANMSSHRDSTSRFKGVSWKSSVGKWHARIMSNGRLRVLGDFTSETEAAAAYNNAAVELHGEFARLNPL